MEQGEQKEPVALPREPCSQGGPVGKSRAEPPFMLFAPWSTFSKDSERLPSFSPHSKASKFVVLIKILFSFKLRMAEFCPPENSCAYVAICMLRSAARSAAVLELPVSGWLQRDLEHNSLEYNLIKPPCNGCAWLFQRAEFGPPIPQDKHRLAVTKFTVRRIILITLNLWCASGSHNPLQCWMKIFLPNRRTTLWNISHKEANVSLSPGATLGYCHHSTGFL